MSDTDNIGKPVYGNTENRRPNSANANWALKDEGSHIYRVLPPFGSLAKLGRWSQYEALHWGFKLSTGKRRAFRCIQRKKRGTNMVTQECPMCTKMESVEKAKQTKIKEMMESKTRKFTKEKIEEAVKPMLDWQRIFNLQKGHFLNVLRPDGQIGRLFVKIKCKNDLDLKIKKIIADDGLDPIWSEQGVWLDFQRHGLGRNDTVYNVEPVYESVVHNGVKMRTIKTAVLGKDVLDRMGKEAFDLATYYKDLTFDEIQMLISSGGDPAIVDSVFGLPTVAKSEPEATDTDAEEYEDPEEMGSYSMVESKPLEPVNQVDDREAALLAQLNELRNKKSTALDSTPKTEAKATGNLDSDLMGFLTNMK